MVLLQFCQNVVEYVTQLSNSFISKKDIFMNGHFINSFWYKNLSPSIYFLRHLSTWTPFYSSISPVDMWEIEFCKGIFSLVFFSFPRWMVKSPPNPLKYSAGHSKTYEGVNPLRLRCDSRSHPSKSHQCLKKTDQCCHISTRNM